jgi:hypothetical protein
MRKQSASLGVRLLIPEHALGLPVLRAFSFVYMLPPLPRRSDWVRTLLNPPSPINLPRKGYRVGLRTSTVAPVASGWSTCRVGLSPTGKRRLCTAHTLSRQSRASASGHRNVAIGHATTQICKRERRRFQTAGDLR